MKSELKARDQAIAELSQLMGLAHFSSQEEQGAIVQKNNNIAQDGKGAKKSPRHHR